MGSDSIPAKTLSDESINQNLVCAHMHSMARTQKILTLIPRWVNAGNKNTPSMLHPRRRKCDHLHGWIKNGHTHAKISPKMVNPRDVAGNTEEETGEEQERDPTLMSCGTPWRQSIGIENDCILLTV